MTMRTNSAWAIITILLFTSDCSHSPVDQGDAGENPYITKPIQVKLGAITKNAGIVYHQDGYIYVMDRNGGNVVQITFDKQSGGWEHVAVSFDRRYIVGNEQLPNPSEIAGGLSRLWLYDLQEGTKVRLLPSFLTAGNGGVDWDQNGYIYFSAKEKDVVANPRTPAEFMANAGANDVYRIRFDGTGLQRLTHTTDRGEADVSVSEDGTLIAYVLTPIVLDTLHTEIWVANADGTLPRLVYKAGEVKVASAHDPELSPDNSTVIFSIVNSTVPPNFPNNPDANTAHDIYSINIDGTGLKRLTKPGHISITPDWKGDLIIFLDISERERYAGVSVIDPHSQDQIPKLINDGANIPKWIP